MPHDPSPWGTLYPRVRKVRKLLVDVAAWAALSPLAFRRLGGARIPADPRSILVVALLKIGDTITTMPLAAALKRRFPAARIGVWTRPESAPLVRAFGIADEVFDGTARSVRAARFETAVVASFVPRHLVQARRAGARTVVGYAYRGRGLFCDVAVPAPLQVGLAVPDYPPGAPILHQVEVVHLLAAPFGITGSPEPPSLAVPEAEAVRAATSWAVPPAGEGPRIAVHPWNDQKHYQWPIDRWISLVRRLVDESRARVWITGGPGDARESGNLAEAVGRPRAVANVAGKVPLPETAALLAHMDLVVAVDTMATHLAAAVGRPVVALFGPGAPRVWRPLGAAHAVIQETRGCHGCRQPRCYRPVHECMEGIGVDAVLAACRERLPS